MTTPAIPKWLRTVVKVERVQSEDGSTTMTGRSPAKEPGQVDPNPATTTTLYHL